MTTGQLIGCVDAVRLPSGERTGGSNAHAKQDGWRGRCCRGVRGRSGFEQDSDVLNSRGHVIARPAIPLGNVPRGVLAAQRVGEGNVCGGSCNPDAGREARRPGCRAGLRKQRDGRAERRPARCLRGGKSVEVIESWAATLRRNTPVAGFDGVSKLRDGRDTRHAICLQGVGAAGNRRDRQDAWRGGCCRGGSGYRRLTPQRMKKNGD